LELQFFLYTTDSKRFEVYMTVVRHQIRT